VKIAHNVKAISKILFILILVLAVIIGSIFSYLLVAGYYINLGAEVPENTTISITDVNLDFQNPETFTVTVLNPTYSLTEAKITEIFVATEDNRVHKILSVNPQLPTVIDKGQKESFNCAWNWGDYTNEILKVIVILEDGSGAVHEIETASTALEITAAVFITTDTQHFNVTIRNPEASAIDLNVTKMTVTMENGTEFNVRQITPSIPKLLAVGTYNTFKCTWDWTYYRGMNATVTVYTTQGYAFHRTEATPKPAQLTITDARFATTDTSSFNITVKNSENSIAVANLTKVEVLLSDGTTQEVSVQSPPELPYDLPIGDTVTLKCLFDWSEKRTETIAITVKTPEGYLGYLLKTLP
jgi:hypothetical protein